jgi:hypothetical protein
VSWAQALAWRESSVGPTSVFTLGILSFDFRVCELDDAYVTQ